MNDINWRSPSDPPKACTKVLVWASLPGKRVFPEAFFGFINADNEWMGWTNSRPLIVEKWCPLTP